MITSLSSQFETARQLIVGLQEGEPSAMEELIQRYSKSIMSFLRRRGVGEQDNADLCSDIFLSVFGAIRKSGVRNAEALQGFVWTIARHHMGAYITGVIRARNTEEPLQEILDFENNPEENATTQEQLAIAHQILRELSSRDREVLVRYYRQEQRPEQIQGEMALTSTQFRLLKSRAKQRFAELGRSKVAGRATHSRRSADVEHTMWGLASAMPKIA